MNLAISEVFYSIQGEGITTGFPSVFVRLGGCNLMCGGMGTQFDGALHSEATWRCDTIEVWMKALSKQVNEILDEECSEAIRNGANLIITGGEPLMQQNGIVGFIDYVKENINKDVYVEIETNGTVMPSEELINRVTQWNCSPKLSNSGNDKMIRINEPVLKTLNSLNTQFKFVITTENDYKEMEQDFSFIDWQKIFLMPSGENQELLNESKQVVAELCKNNYLKFTNRLHIEIWNKKTGV